MKTSDFKEQIDDAFERRDAGKPPRLLNITAIKTHALKCSKETRAGKFERVSQDFIDQVEADVETIIRAVNAAASIADGFKPVAPEPGSIFVTGAMADKLGVAMSDAVARIIQRRVHRHPSIGKTLMG